MITLQRPPRILCPDMLVEVNLQKDPTLADLGTGDFSRPCLVLERNRVNLQIGGSFLQGEGGHGYSSSPSLALR